MKKLIASLAVAFLMAAGLVAGTTSTASAGPYSGSVSTICNAQATPASIRVNQRPKVRVNIRPAQGNGNPRGPVQISFNSRDGEVTRTYQRFYNGSPRTYGFNRLPRSARYNITVTYIGYSQTVYRPCATSARLFVRSAR